MDDVIAVFTRLAQPRDWVAHARCHDAPTSLFFPERGDHASAAQAKAICRGCPVIEQCLDYALDGALDVAGVWGGTTNEDRVDIKRRRRLGAAS